MRDYPPSDMIPREQLMSAVREVFREWGYAPMETPAIEYLDILTGKYGEEAAGLLYHLEHPEQLALRYDLTVPLTRWFAMHRREIAVPFKRYQIQPVWRAERAQISKGRFREFYQCDVDIIGSKSLLADAEIIAVVANTMEKIGIPEWEIRLNHRGLLYEIVRDAGFPEGKEVEVCQSLDKLDKIGRDGVISELVEKKGFALQNAEKLMKKSAGGVEQYAALSEAKELKEIISYADIFGVSEERITIDLSLARGLAYYTGSIFEVAPTNLPKIGSLAGGGRYDGLVGLFSKEDAPAVGCTIGLDRILVAMGELGLTRQKHTVTEVVAIHFPETIGRTASLLRELHASNISAELYPDPKPIRKQFNYIDKLGAPIALILGEDEIQNGTVQLKDMRTGNEQTVPIEQLIVEAKKLLQH